MNLAKKSGNLLIATGILHNLIGLVMGWCVLSEIVRSGFVNSIGNDMDRNAIFWFLFGGFMMMLLGKLIQDYLDADWLIPKWLCASLLLLSVIGCIMMPASGFWIGVPQGFLMMSTRWKRRRSLV